MKISAILRYSLLMGTLLFLYACGGGGGGGGSSIPSTVINGVAQAGVFNGATVKIYGYDASSALTQLTTSPAVVTTDSSGKYSASVGSYTGAVVVKVFGTFHDEASNTDITVPEANALQAAVASASGTVSIPVTVLTDVAVRKASAAGSIKDNIASANQAISALYGFDIIGTIPVAPSASALAASGVTDAQKKYTTTLTALSQYVLDMSGTSTPSASDLEAALAKLASGITVTGSTAAVTSPQVALNLQQAATAVSTNSNTTTSIAAAGTSATTILSSLGTVGNTSGNKILAVKLKTVGTFSSTIFGVKAVTTLPTGAHLRTDAITGQPADGTVVLSGNSVDAPIFAKSLASGVLTIGIAAVHDLSGEFAICYFDVPVDSTLTAADFTVSGEITYDSGTSQGLKQAWPMAAF